MIGIFSPPVSRARPNRVRGSGASFRLLVLASALATALVAAPHPSLAQSPGSDVLREVRDRARAGELEQALAIIDRFVADSPGSPIAPSALLLAATLEENSERAIARWNRVIADYPATPEARSARLAVVRFLFARALYPQCEGAAQELLAQHGIEEPVSSEGNYWLLLARIGSGAPAEGSLRLLGSIRQEPWAGRAAVALGNSLAESGDWRKAAELLQGESESDDPRGLACEALLGIAQTWRQRGETEGARRALESLLGRWPEGFCTARAKTMLRELGRAEAAPTGGPRHAVEIGVFDTEDAALAFVQDFTGRRSEKPSVVSRAGASGKTVWRVLAGVFTDRTAAEDLARELTEAGIPARVEAP